MSYTAIAATQSGIMATVQLAPRVIDVCERTVPLQEAERIDAGPGREKSSEGVLPHPSAWRLLYVVKGCYQVRQGRHLYSVGTGDSHLLLPEVPYDFERSRLYGYVDSADVVVLAFEMPETVGADEYWKLGCPEPGEGRERSRLDGAHPVILGNNAPELASSVRTLLYEHQRKWTNWEVVTSALLRFVIVQFFRAWEITANGGLENAIRLNHINEQKVRAVDHYIDLNFKKTFYIKDLCKLLHISRPRLFEIYKAARGKTPTKVVLEKRIAEAKVLLAGGASVKHTALEVGFLDPDYFSRFFKSHVGVAPSEFQAGRRTDPRAQRQP